MKPDAIRHVCDPWYLRELVRRTGLKQGELAARLGLSPRLVRYYLSTTPKAGHEAPYLFQFALEALAGSAPARDPANRRTP